MAWSHGDQHGGICKCELTDKCSAGSLRILLSKIEDGQGVCDTTPICQVTMLLPLQSSFKLDPSLRHNIGQDHRQSRRDYQMQCNSRHLTEWLTILQCLQAPLAVFQGAPECEFQPSIAAFLR